MKKVIKIGLIFIFAVLSGCNNEKEKRVTIGFLIHSLSSSRWQMDIAYVKERAEEIGATVVLKDAGGDENMQLKQASELLNEGVDAIIVVAANQNTAGGIVREAHKKNVPVIGYDRIIKNADLDYLVSFEYDYVGQYMVDYAINKKPKGNYVVFWGDATDGNAIFVKNGHDKALASYIENGDVNIVYKTFVEGWTKVNAKHIMNEILDFYPDKIDVVVASNDPIGIGAYEALLEHGYNPNDVIITGQDATLEYVHSMLQGGMTMSVFKPIKELAYGAVDMVYGLLKDGEVSGFDKTVYNGRKNVSAKLFSPSIIDESNMEAVLIQGEVFTHEQVYQEN